MTHKMHDPIYGTLMFESPVFTELIKSVPVQRLKKITQSGLPDEISYKKDHFRYEHSVGVMLALKRLGATEEEQIAGLLHDVSHRAFSHIYDWVIEDYSKAQVNNEEAQDDSHEQYIKESEIPTILVKYGYNADKISDLKSYKLLDTELPDLCADRIDYSLRQLSPKKAARLFNGLTVVEGKIVCKNQDVARQYAREFLRLQTTMWAGYESAARYHLLSSILKRALSLKIISMDDFWTDDVSVLEKLKKSKDSKIIKVFGVLRQKSIPKPRIGVLVYKKFRYIDPLVVQKTGKLIRLSDLDLKFKKDLEREKKLNSKGILVPDTDL